MAVKRKGLGRGLEALFSEVESIPPEQNDSNQDVVNEIHYIGLNDIKPNDKQPRKDFSRDKIEELAASIQRHGIIQPIMVRTCENGYEIVAGERRWRAARVAGLDKIPCIIRELNEKDNMIVAVIENMQREDLNPIEEANAFQELMGKCNLTQGEVSMSVGKSRPYITNSLRLLKLPEEVKEMLVNGSLSNGHARALISVEDKDFQLSVAKAAVAEGLSVRAVEKRISDANLPKKAKSQRREKNHEIKRIESQLKDVFGTKVSIHHGPKRGKIEIEYFSQEELERLLDMFIVSRET